MQGGWVKNLFPEAVDDPLRFEVVKNGFSTTETCAARHPGIRRASKAAETSLLRARQDRRPVESGASVCAPLPTWSTMSAGADLRANLATGFVPVVDPGRHPLCSRGFRSNGPAGRCPTQRRCASARKPGGGASAAAGVRSGAGGSVRLRHRYDQHSSLRPTPRGTPAPWSRGSRRHGCDDPRTRPPSWRRPTLPATCISCAVTPVERVRERTNAVAARANPPQARAT